MQTILLYGLKSKVGGGRSILTNFLNLLKQRGGTGRYIVLTPQRMLYKRFENSTITVLEVPNIYKHNSAALLLYNLYLPRLIARHHISHIINFGDIVIPVACHQLYLFDWPYAAYPESLAWGQLGLYDHLIRKVKLAAFRRSLRYATIIAVQTPSMRSRLQRLYGLRNLVVIPNAVSLENLTGGESKDYKLTPDRKHFLYLSHYYSHKNIEVFLPLAEAIRARKRPYVLVTTISAAQHSGARAFLDEVRRRGLTDIIRNIGPVEMVNVPSLYQQCDGLLMPTLLESFSGSYVEAMYHRRIILTSDLEFARDVCGDYAYYFRPTDVESILKAIDEAEDDRMSTSSKIDSAEKRLQAMPTWSQVYDQIIGLVVEDGASSGSDA